MAPRRRLPALALSVARPICVAIEPAADPMLYTEHPPDTALDPFRGFDRIYTFHGDECFLKAIGSVSTVRHLDPHADSYIVHHLARILLADRIALATDAPSLRVDGPRSDPSCVFFHPGGGTGSKRWPADMYVTLLADLRDKHPGMKAVLILGEAERDLRGAMTPLFDEILDEPPLDSLPSLLHGRPYLGMDSGITHLAAASGARVLALFGPTDPEIWAQRRPNYEYLRATNLATLDSRAVSARMSRLISNVPET